MRIAIDQSFARLGLNIKQQKLSIQQKQSEFKFKLVSDTLEIDRIQQASLEIDNTNANYDMGIKKSRVLSKESAQKGIQVALKGIAKYAREGNQLADIQKEGEPLIEQAKRRMGSKKKEIVLKWKRNSQINFTPAKQKINFNLTELDGIRLESKVNFPKLNWNPGKVNVYLKQKPELKIRAVDVVG